MLVALADRYPGASLCGLDLALNMARQTLLRFNRQGLIVNGDAERLPFRDGAFDLVVSASTFQWLGSLETGFRECLRVLRGDGLLCVAFFGGRTLWELQECYREAVACRFGAADNRLSRLRRFRGRGETERMLEGLDCDRLLIAQEVEMDYHPDVPGLLRSIKGIGAAIAGSDGSGGLGWRGILSDMARIYWDRFRTEAGLPATYEVVYVLVKRCRGC
jgi:malonyl-CoA O-methyltransferase